ncbi:Protein CBG17189 [Caenorhabditis briggsae]|uniref:Protein CBG17189 n=1 Tax=Caenorhabditis briggsae TaxID=6238 RepID=A8XQL4_CAEBR|nr:Protein CBG17189 [Caenorhabditis briggsae]CAP34939.1 Protein CBG17189 [Caenorhabditis briggsae]
MIRASFVASMFFIVAVHSKILNKNSENVEIQQLLNMEAAAIERGLSAVLMQEGQSSDLIVRAERYYGCGCGCGCAKVAVVSAAPCAGCCGCGYGK